MIEPYYVENFDEAGWEWDVVYSDGTIVYSCESVFLATLVRSIANQAYCAGMEAEKKKHEPRYDVQDESDTRKTSGENENK